MSGQERETQALRRPDSVPSGCSSPCEQGNFGALTRQVIFRRRPEGTVHVHSSISVIGSLRRPTNFLLVLLIALAGFVALSGGTSDSSSSAQAATLTFRQKAV